MKSLFTRTLEAFILAFMLFIVIVSLVFVAGMDKSLNSWDRENRRQLNEAFLTLLEKEIEDGQELASITLHPGLKELIPDATPLLVFDRDKNLLATYRSGFEGGEWEPFYLRNHHQEIEYHEITAAEALLGYFYIGLPKFSNNPANQQLLKSIEGALWIGIGTAFLLSFVVAYLFSRRHAEAAELVASGINRIARGEFELKVPEKGAREIIRIARNANRLGKELKREAELRSQWSQDITHDLRTPLSALRAQLEGMKDGVLDFTPRRIAMNLAELERIENLVEDLGILNRLEIPETRLKTGPVKSGNLIEALENRFGKEWKTKKIRVYLQEEVDTFPGDKDLLLRGVSNIMDNAIRHTPAGGVIRLCIRREGAETIIRLHNEGDTIPPAELKKVFDRLYRGEFARHSPGSGLGLTITKKIVERHHGRIGIHSDGNGTVVRIALPGGI